MLINNLKFNGAFFRDVWGLLKPYWVSNEKWSVWLLFSLQILCILGEVVGHVAFNSFHKTFYNALQEFNKPVIISSLEMYLGIIVFFVLSQGGNLYFQGLLGLRWRRWLTKKYLHQWLDNHTHYRLAILNNNVDNPDQRISEDLDKFPTATLALFHKFVNSFLMLCSFGYILWILSPKIIIPGIFCWIAFLYAMLGSAFIAWLGRFLANLDYYQQKLNANFRFGLARLRETSEQVAVYRGEQGENHRFLAQFAQVFSNTMDIVSLKTRLVFFSKGYGFAAYVIGLAISMPLYLAKNITLGIVMQTSSAFNSVNSAFSVFIEAFNDLADWRSIVYRITEFNQSMNQLSKKTPSTIIIEEQDSPDMIINELSLNLPEGKQLLQNINLVLPQGESILLSGPSGVGKTTLLRTLAGLWPYGEGRIYLPRQAKKLFLSQKPYLPLGSLKEALLYPHHVLVEDSDLQKVLVDCGLEHITNQLNQCKNWAQELSLGEQQLIAFARIIIHQPEIIFLDEATSALDEETEFKMYKKLRACLPRATVISVGHRSSLRQFHDHCIHFSEQLSPILLTGV